ncbi:MAG TPA: type II CRISPR RNA-guided endonuclease Cas9, partial [Firmicutes bacterium]|nr:type II CRISPR RNA-guided endonuclease Cas9 [Bacillota bacterium]
VDFKNHINKDSDNPLIVKVRELNDLHHAKDAYLNIVVGNVYYTKFNKDASVYFKNNGIDSYNMSKLFDGNVKNAWMPSMKEKIVTVVNKNTCRVVRFTSEGKGELFNATIKSKGANGKLIPLKRNCPLENIAKYGGYDNATTAYFALVRSIDKKGKMQLSIEAIPIYVDMLGKENVFDYLKNCVSLTNPQILIDNIKINSLLKLNGAYVWLRGKTNNSLTICNANQLILDRETAIYSKRIVSYLEKRKKNKAIEIDERYDKIDRKGNQMLYNTLVEKLMSRPYANISTLRKQSDFLVEKRDTFESLTLEEQCIVLNEILHLMQCNSALSNFELLKGVSKAGSLTCNKKLSANDECLLITQSPTGYYKDVKNLTSFYKQ